MSISTGLPRIGIPESPERSGKDAPHAGGLRTLAKFKLEIAILLLLALTYGAVRYADRILYKELVVSRESGAPFFMDGYSDRQEGTGHSTLTLDPANPMHGTCVLRQGFFPNPFCGLEIVFADKSGTRGIDLSSYRSLTIDLSYKGPSKSFRLFVKNYDPRYSKPHARATSKFHTTEVFHADGRIRKEIPLSLFPVAEWWVVREQEDPQATLPEMNNVISIDVGTATGPQLGRHDFLIHSVTLTGTTIPLDQWYLGILGCWVLLIGGFLSHRVMGFRKREAAMRRLRSLETEQLQLAKAAAERASSAKSSFLSQMTHELRTPLNAILGYAQLIERGVGQERFTAAARTIRESGSHLLGMINDILDLSKIEAGKLELDPARFDLRACLRGVEEIIRIRAAEKDLEFRCHVSPDIPAFVIGDEKRLRQVLINLLGNSVKFTRTGEVTMHVSLVEIHGHAAELRFEVQDSGIGLAPEELARIFNPFEQAGSKEQKADGTGLGLSISSQFVALMGSSICVESQQGSGSRFWFNLALPIVEGDGASLCIADHEIKGYAGPRKTILIVDDIAVNRLLLAQQLEELGFNVVEADDGAQAILEAERCRPDLILMDVRMPIMGGPEATRQLRSRPDFETLPIVAVTAGTSPEMEAEARDSGADRILSKPLPRSELLRTVSEMLRIEWTSQPPAAEPEAGEALVAPPQERMDVLLDLARAGKLKAIIREADAIIALDARYRPFGEKLQKLARAYQSPAILDLIERHDEKRQAA